MNAAIITIGDELISGGVIDTNSSFIARNLTLIGIETILCTSVGDDSSLIQETINNALKKSDLIIISGGIGPTGDDITRETISEIVGKKLIVDPRIFESIQAKLGKLGLKMAKSDKKQALFPEGARIVTNPVGIAGGFIVRFQKKPLIVLPGVPRELKSMMKESIIPFLLKEGGGDRIFKSRTLKVFGIAETRVEESLQDILREHTDLKVSFLPNYFENHIRITAAGKNEKEAESILAKVGGKIRQKMGRYFFGIDDQTLESVTGDLLRSKNMTLAVAESCTGGLIAHCLTNVPGSSDYFKQGVVAYSNQTKIDLLGVPADIIKTRGAVSEETAGKMAEGVKKLGKTTLGLATTGAAGPEGLEDSPVGKIFIAISGFKGTEVRDYNFSGSRELIKLMTSHTALYFLRNYLTGEDSS